MLAFCELFLRSFLEAYFKNTRCFINSDLGLDVVNGVTGLDIERDRFASQRLHKDLHTPAQTQHQVKGGLFLDVIVRKRTSVFQLLSSEDQALLVRRDSFFVLDLGLN